MTLIERRIRPRERSFPSIPYRIVDNLGNTGQAVITQADRLGRNGEEGFVYPVYVKEPGIPDRRLQAKRSHGYTDGNGFAAKEAQESFDNLLLLQQLGFKVLPFFAIATSQKGGKILVMTDLTYENTKYVIEESDILNHYETEQEIRGEKREIDAYKTSGHIANLREVESDQLRTTLLSWAHGVSLGNGEAEMLVVDPQTNVGEVFITDVGSVHFEKSKYKDAANADQLSEVPEQEIRDTFVHLLQSFHPELNAEELYQRCLEQYGERKIFQDLLYKATIGMALEERMGGWGMDEEWAKRRFARIDFPDHFLRLKTKMDTLLSDASEILGYSLLDTSKDAHDRFIAGRTEDDLMLGINFAIMAALDLRIGSIIDLKKAVDNEEITNDQIGSTIWGQNGFPKMRVFDNYDEEKGKTTVIEATDTNLYRKDIIVDVELDWQDAYTYEQWAMKYGKLPAFTPGRVKGIKINGNPIQNFDPDLIGIYLWKGLSNRGKRIETEDRIAYFYGNNLFCEVTAREEQDLNKINTMMMPFITSVSK